MTKHHQTVKRGGRRWSGVGRAVVLLSAVWAAGWAQAQLAIQSVSAATQGGAEVIRIQASEPIRQMPSGFATQTPARIALDFAGASNGLGRNLVELNQGNLRSANVVEAGDRTRVVLNLNQSVKYQTRIEEGVLLVVLEPAAAPSPAAADRFAESANQDVLPLSDIDFRRGADSTGRVIVNLANSQVGVDIRQQGKNLVVEFLKTSLPQGMSRRLDVVDFGTPVQTITTTQVGDRVRMLVEPTGQWEHSAYQSDRQFVLEVRTLKEDPTKLTQGAGYAGEKLSLNFQNIEVRSLLQVIADFTNFNIVTSDSVTGNVTLRLKDVPWDQALDIILQAKGLGMRKNGNVIWIAPKEEILAKEKTELESQQQIRTLEPVRTQSFRLNFAKADDVAKQLSASVGTGENAVRILSRQGSVFAEPRTNQLFVTDISSKLAEIEGLIKKVDVPVKQVLIEARIVEASDDFSKNLGVRFGARLNEPVTLLRNNGNRLNTTFGFGSLGGTSSTNVTSIPQTDSGGSTFALSLFSPNVTRLLNLEIEANESDSNLKTIASPRVVTADQKEAKIEDGRKFPFLKQDADGNTTIEWIDASLMLVVTPQITPDGDVIMELNVKNDSPIVFNGETAVQTKSVQTQVLVQNGGTVMIGGIYLQEESSGVDKVPVLGDVPVFGNLFKTRRKSLEKSELLVFITPRILPEGAGLASGR